MDDAGTKYYVIHSWWLSSGAATKEGILGLSDLYGIRWDFSISVIDNGVVTCYL